MTDKAGPNQSGDEPDFRIATIKFAFDNGEIIKLLTKRGQFLE